MMRNLVFLRDTLLIVLFLLLNNCTKTADEISLWPEIEPYQSGYLKVSDIHEIHYELCGNPDGKPVFVLHGGPGGSCSPYMRRFFNPEIYKIILHDQRGAGKSKPFAELKENTTQNLVQDIEHLRIELKVGKIIIFGGSWGSTLGLAYAEQYPDNVEAMVLRGVFTASKSEIDHFYHGGVKTHFPEVYDKFTASLPDSQKRPLPEYMLSLIENPDSLIQLKYSRAWAEYEIKLSSLNLPDKQVNDILDSFNPVAFAKIENYYMANGCFFEDDQLLNEIDKLKDIPIIMVNGRYDVICPPITAHKIQTKLPKAKLIIAESAGHWMGEKPIEKELLKVMRDIE
jgi:proline iminopeptidase